MALRQRVSWWDPEPGAVPLSDTTVAELLDSAAARVPDAEAVVMSAYEERGLNVRWTYRELADRVDLLARGLIATGIQVGEPVALCAPNVADWLVVEFAVARVGAVLVPVNPTYRAEEMRHVLVDSGAVACLFLPAFDKLEIWPQITRVRGSLPALRQLISLAEAPDGVPALADILRRADDVPPDAARLRAAAVNADQVAQIQYTSGTTGAPKGALLTHRNLVNNARQSAWLWRIGVDDRWCNPLPLFHTAGCGMLALGAVAAGATHLPLVRFDPSRVLATVERERCTVLEVVPTMLIALVERQRSHRVDVSSLRLIGTSGAPTPAGLGEACAQEWGVPLRVLYGSTELSPTVSGTGLDEPGDLGWTTVGAPLPWTEVRIVEPADRTVLAVGEAGELEVRGYQVMSGYSGRPEATAEAISPDGWFATGDLARMDGTGRLRVVGRQKDVVIRGGENLYPAEIEDVIRGHPAVADAAVVAVPDAFFGEEACAVLCARDGMVVDPDELRAWLRHRVSHQKVPRYLTVVDRLPQTSSGKVQKFLLREQVRSLFGNAEETPR